MILKSFILAVAFIIRHYRVAESGEILSRLEEGILGVLAVLSSGSDWSMGSKAFAKIWMSRRRSNQWSVDEPCKIVAQALV